MQIYIWTIILFMIPLLDLIRVYDLSKKKWLIPYLFFAPHLPLLVYYICYYLPKSPGVSYVLFWTSVVFFQLYTTLRVHFHRLRKNESGSTRIGILYGGRNLIHAGNIGLYLLPLWYVCCYLLLPKLFPALGNPYRIVAYEAPYESFPLHTFLISAEVIYAVIFVWLFLANGCLRIFFTSRNLGIVKRLFICLFMWVPFVQLYLAHIMCRAAKDEYLVAVHRRDIEAFHVKDDACATKYPLILLHGIGFRDLRFFNYWGRIPLLLANHGAKIYYGHQKAWGIIEENTVVIAKTIDRALEENNCDKVNIIAHSKGGLEARYLISSMGYGDRVASLTTINTPHYGSELITLLNKLPDSIYRFIANCINRPFILAGDDKPDCYSSSKQLDPIYCQEFNEKNKDVPGVYYQSFGSVMKSCFSDSLLSIPYLLMCTCKGRQNDGLVDISSVQWGNFRGILKNKYRRGISHGDMIDLKREDIKGFDVLNVFYEIVAELKKNGF